MEKLALDELHNRFFDKGYVILKAEDRKYLDDSRQIITNFLRQKYGINENNDERILNNIHKIIDINDTIANNIVLNAIKDYSNNLDMAKSIFETNKTFLSSILGPDISAQKHANIVFQYPLSKRNSELHYDSPPNSRHELVAWAPLVDCYGTKSFYVIEKEESYNLYQQYLNDTSIKSWEDLKQRARAQSKNIEIKYGEVLYFSANLFHGSEINHTEESRWSLNTRFKNLFAPCGLKDPFTFYKVLKKSAITNIATRY